MTATLPAATLAELVHSLQTSDTDRTLRRIADAASHGRMVTSEALLDDPGPAAVTTVATPYHRRDREAVTGPARPAVPSVDGGVDDVVTRAHLAWLLGALDARDRAVMTALYIDGTPVCQIARDLGVDQSRISQLHRRALQRMRIRAGIERPR